MKQFHGTFRGWLEQRIPGNKLFLLGLFLMFYLALAFGPSSLVPDELRKAETHSLLLESDSLMNSHVLNVSKLDGETDTP